MTGKPQLPLEIQYAGLIGKIVGPYTDPSARFDSYDDEAVIASLLEKRVEFEENPGLTEISRRRLRDLVEHSIEDVRAHPRGKPR